MSDVVIRAEGLSKKFKIGSNQPYHRFSELLTGLGHAAIRVPKKLLSRKQTYNKSGAVDETRSDEFWALQDINFEVRQGEVVGIIGRNGAGKSTLLKILSRITEPTIGRFGVKGRVGSLLEVGTGFHPELTGRENIFLSGAILGMTRSEIKSKFDEIVEFSGVEQFLDTPMKRYSSGMQVRLGFAVAAHLEPEILIVDEVLAVGDAEFQKKCLGKMNDVAGSGRTILFVSHNMDAVSSLCKNALLLSEGSLTLQGSTEEVLSRYHQTNINTDQGFMNYGNHQARLIDYQIKQTVLQDHGCENIHFDLSFQFSFDAKLLGKSAKLAIGFNDSHGLRVGHLESDFIDQSLLITKETMLLKIQLIDVILRDGNYRLTLYMTVGPEVVLWIRDEILLHIPLTNYWGTQKSLGNKQSQVLMRFNISLIADDRF